MSRQTLSTLRRAGCSERIWTHRAPTWPPIGRGAAQQRRSVWTWRAARQPVRRMLGNSSVGAAGARGRRSGPSRGPAHAVARTTRRSAPPVRGARHRGPRVAVRRPRTNWRSPSSGQSVPRELAIKPGLARPARTLAAGRGRGRGRRASDGRRAHAICRSHRLVSPLPSAVGRSAGARITRHDRHQIWG